MNKDSFVEKKVEQFAGRFPKQPFLPDMKAFVGSSLSEAIEEGARRERERIAEEAGQFRNNLATAGMNEDYDQFLQALNPNL